MSFFGPRPPRNPSSLIAFYEGTGEDHRGRFLSDILRWSASKLEQSHDYIQTVFPLPEGSGVNWDAPIIDRQVFDAFRSRAELRGKLRESFQKILWFYGFKLEAEDGVYKVVKGDNYDKHADNWDSRFDHNHLRITRIIRSLRVLGLEDEALAFRSALEENLTRVSSISREYWRRAAERSLNLKPDLEIDDDDDDRVGPKFLREFVQERKKRSEVDKKPDTTKETSEKEPVSEVKEVASAGGDAETKSADGKIAEENVGEIVEAVEGHMEAEPELSAEDVPKAVGGGKAT